MPRNSPVGMFNIPNFIGGSSVSANQGLRSSGLGGSSGSLVADPFGGGGGPQGREVGAPGLGIDPTTLGPDTDACLHSMAVTGNPTPCPPNQSHQPAPCGPCTVMGSPGDPTGQRDPVFNTQTGVATTKCQYPTSPDPGFKPGEYTWDTSTCSWRSTLTDVRTNRTPILTEEDKKIRDIVGGTRQYGGQRGAQGRQELGQFGRMGGGIGGGAMADMEMFENPLLAGGSPYLGKNVLQFDKGGKLTGKEKDKLKKLGRRGDTELAHVNPQEKAMLKAMGGSGTINPYTGLREYGWFTDLLGDVMGTITSPFALISGALGGREDVLGQFMDNITMDDTRRNIFGEHTFMGGQFDQGGEKIAVFDEETGTYEIETSDPNQRMGIDPTGGLYGSPGWGFTTRSPVTGDIVGTGSLTGQAVSGSGWGQPPKQYSGAAPRSPRQRVVAEDKVKVVDPFRSDFGGVQGDQQASTMGLEGYRWDLANPYIRENVDIFAQGGKMKNYYNQGGRMKNPYNAYPDGGRADFMSGMMKGMNSAVAAGQIEQVVRNNRSSRRFTSGGKF